MVFFIKPGDFMKLSGDKVRHIKVGKNNKEGNTLTLSFAIYEEILRVKRFFVFFPFNINPFFS
jgi:hypothetical protein